MNLSPAIEYLSAQVEILSNNADATEPKKGEDTTEWEDKLSEIHDLEAAIDGLKLLSSAYSLLKS